MTDRTELAIPSVPHITMESYNNNNTTSLSPTPNPNPSNPPILAAAAALAPRYLDLVGPAHHIELGGAILFSFTLTLCVGVLLPCCACAGVYRIFSRILDDALTRWALSPPSNQVVLEAGNVRIEFGCAMLQPVPWEFVAEMALSGREAVRRGFMPFFQRQWWWVRNGTEGGGEEEGEGRVCYVGIRVVEEGRVVVPPEL